MKNLTVTKDFNVGNTLFIISKNINATVLSIGVSIFEQSQTINVCLVDSEENYYYVSDLDDLDNAK